MEKREFVIVVSLVLVIVFVLSFYASVLTQKQISQSPNKPLVISNYFLTRYAEPKSIGNPIVFYADDRTFPTGAGRLRHNVGRLEGQKWVARTLNDNPGFFSFGPYLTRDRLDSLLTSANTNNLPANKFYKVIFEMESNVNDFSSRPVARLDVKITRPSTGATKVVAFRDLYRHDFIGRDRLQNFSLTFPHYLLQGDEQVEFRVYWYKENRLSLNAIYIEPREFKPLYGGFGSSTSYDSNGNLVLPSTDLRYFNPENILTHKTNVDGSISSLSSIDWWRRDIKVGQEGAYPYIGVYDASDPEILRYQIRQAKSAGIDAFSVATYTLPSRTWDNFWVNFRMLLMVAEEENFKIMLDNSLLEGSTFISNKNYPASYDYNKILQEFDILLKDESHKINGKTYFEHSAYLKKDGKPVYMIPLVFERDTGKIKTFVSNLNSRYKTATKSKTNLYIMAVPFTTFGHGTVSNPGEYFVGPFNTQTVFFDKNMRVDNPESNFYRWTDYFNCNEQPVYETDLLLNCSCKYGVQSSSGYCVFLAGLINRPGTSSYSSSGVNAYLDWAPYGVALWPRSWVLEGNLAFLTPLGNQRTLSDWTYSIIVNNARSVGLDAVVSVEPAHDKRNYINPPISYELVSRTEDRTSELRFKRILRDAVAANPDILWIENWNGWAESVNIEPSVHFKNDNGQIDPDIYLKILAQQFGMTYVKPCIPKNSIDPLRVPYIPNKEFC